MKPLLDLDLLNTFAVVVEAGGFKEASSRLYRSQAAVSMQIKRLEEHLGHRLLERSNQGIRLTEPGKTLLGYIDRLLRLNNETLSALSLEPLRGQVHFGIPTDYAQAFVQEFIPRIRAAFPELVPRITCGRSRRLREMITIGELDMAIVTGEPQFAPEQSLWSEALCWYASVSLPISAEDTLPVALLESDCALRDLAASDLKQSGLDYDPVLTSSDVANLYSAVESGMAMALLPESSVISSKVRPIQLDQLPEQRRLTMNIINAGTLSPSFHEPLQARILDAARATHDRATAS